MLFVPATRWEMIVKAVKSGADSICVDLEDSVPADVKEVSRSNVIRAFTKLDFGDRVRMFRMNALNTPFAYRDLIEVVESAGNRIDQVMLPKCSGAGDVAFVSRLLGQIEQRHGFSGEIGIEAQIETAAGFTWLREIAAESRRLRALIFGSGDYAASMRMPATGIGTRDANDEAYPGHRWHAVMHAIVAAARTFGIRCVDGPYSDFRNLEGFEESCRVARMMGFDGKQCIHPGQVAAVNRIFGPTPDEIAHARRVVEAYDAAATTGRGAISLDGQMVDEANVRMARVVLRQAANLGAADSIPRTEP